MADRAVAIYRNPRYSPQRHMSNDRLIMDAVVESLTNLGWNVEAADERQIEDGLVPPAPVYVNMCQGPVASQALREAMNGARSVNAPASVLNCHRHRLVGLMKDSGLPFPATELHDVQALVAPGASPLAATGARLWLKRGDVHAETPDDVVAVDEESLPAAAAQFLARGIGRVAIQAHVPGPVIKFYALADGSFFHWYFSEPGECVEVPNPDALRELAIDASRVAGLEVFGGDIVLEDGARPVLIDLNDWPSFAPVRQRAAAAIARYINSNARNGHDRD